MTLSYDPNVAPPSTQWLSLGEAQRIDLVTAYHRAAAGHIANDRLHAIIHVIVETQLALGEPVVVDTMARLERSGLTRHDGIHAIGDVLTAHLQSLMRADSSDGEASAHGAYVAGLKALRVGGK
jgi:hypothetical protein